MFIFFIRKLMFLTSMVFFVTEVYWVRSDFVLRGWSSRQATGTFFWAHP